MAEGDGKAQGKAEVKLTINPVCSINGSIRPPSDKSLTHRAYMFAAFASSESVVRNPLRGEDCENTLRAMIHLGLRHEMLGPEELRLIPTKEWMQPYGPIDCGNSGTTMRLLAGLVASRPLNITFIGDASLSKRPMGRIRTPLELMGAEIEGERPPLTIRGGSLKGIDYISPVASAQVKSCTLLAGLRAEGITSVSEPSLSRDHTERMLRAMGCQLTTEGLKVSIEGGQEGHGFEFNVPGDISSAAFFVVATALLPNSRLEVIELSVNPTRTGLLDVLTQCQTPFALFDIQEQLGEPVGSLVVETANHLQPFSIEGDLVPRLIDEIPVLAVLATQCEGTSIIRNAKELRVKESDRIELVANGLRGMGAKVETFEDGMAITGPTKLRATKIDAHGDHRIAMAFAIAGLIAEGTTEIDGADSIATSFPGFEVELARLCQPVNSNL
ncbi:MAG: 3-phosphoshikimate 1-carboxyvinyltransferase [Armatimonadota bacterium]